MKKFLVLILLVLLPVVAFSQDIVYYNSTPTLMWNAITDDVNGDPLLPDDVVSYNIYLWNTADGDIELQPIASLNYFGVTTDTQMILSFTNRYEWVCAVEAIHTDGGGNSTVLDIGYTTNELDVEYSPFVYAPFLQTPSVIDWGLRDSAETP